MAERKELLLKKKEQGFTELLISPFGMSLKELINRTRKLILEKHKQKKLLGTDGYKLDLNQDESVYTTDDYEQGNADNSGELIYDIKKYDINFHGGKTKKEILENIDKKENFLGYHVMLIEDLPDLPTKGKVKAGRKQLEANMSPEQYLELLKKKDQYRGETGLTPEDQLSYLIYYLKKNNQVIDDWEGKGKLCFNINSYFISSGLGPLTRWNRGSRQLILSRDFSYRQHDAYGVRSAVRI